MHLMLGDISIPINIDTVSIRSGTIVYRHRHKYHDVQAVLQFDRLSATHTNVANHGSDTLTLHTATRVMGEGTLTVDARFAPHNRLGRQTLMGRFEQTSFSAFNPVLQNMVFIEAKSGYLNWMEFEMELDDQSPQFFDDGLQRRLRSPEG